MNTYFRILSFGKPYWAYAVVSLVCLILATIFGAISLVSVIPFLDILFSDQTAIQAPQEWNWFDIESLKSNLDYQLAAYIEKNSKMQTLNLFCISLGVIFLLKNISRYFSAFFIAPFEQGVIKRIRTYTFNHLANLDIAFFTKRKKGDLIGMLVSDVQVIQESVISTVQAVFREPITVVINFLLLLAISWKLTLFTIIVLPLTAFFINRIRKPLKSLATKGQKALGELVAITDEFISGVRIVKAFQKEDFEVDKYDRKNRDYTNLQIAIRRKMELASPVSELISIGVVCLIILYGGSLILSGSEQQLDEAEFIGFIAIFSQFINPIKVFSNSISRVQKGIAAFHRIEDLIAIQAQITNPTSPTPFPAFSSHIQFESVSFKYSDEDVLKNISFRIEKGQTIALVGPSGGGKSTLADLVLRFYDPYKGSIAIDDINVRQIAISALREKMGVVSQEAILFHETILNNIAYGIENPDLEQVMEAARIANAHEFIEKLPQGYHTLIGERGTRLSGGQRQRISIARAILKNPPILILDEATSNLDTESERLVQDALQHLMSDRTSLVIAHRLSTITSADLIIVIENGEIVERGTHKELIQQNGLYNKLHELQFQAG